MSNLGAFKARIGIVFRSWFVQSAEESREHCDASQHDLDLYITLVNRGADAIDFNHLRPLNWQP
jgi:hypothetical protein